MMEIFGLDKEQQIANAEAVIAAFGGYCVECPACGFVMPVPQPMATKGRLFICMDCPAYLEFIEDGVAKALTADQIDQLPDEAYESYQAIKHGRDVAAGVIQSEQWEFAGSDDVVRNIEKYCAMTTGHRPGMPAEALPEDHALKQLFASGGIFQDIAHKAVVYEVNSEKSN